MKKREVVGLLVFVLGLMSADSECLALPIALLVMGFIIYGGRKEEE